MVFTRDELLEVTKQITTGKTGIQFDWKFEVSENIVVPGGAPRLLKQGWLVRMAFQRPDANTGVVGTGYGRWELIEQGTSISGVVKTCWLLYELIVRHEMMEAFLWKGARIFNPHNTVDQLASINP